MRISIISQVFVLLCCSCLSVSAQSHDPLTFELVNDAGDAVVYIDNDANNQGEEMRLTFVNNDIEPLFFAPLTGTASRDNYHLKLQVKHLDGKYFTKTSLAKIKLNSTSAQNFQMTIDISSSSEWAYFYIINTSQLEMLPNVRQYIGLTGFKANSASGPMASTEVRLYYHHAYYKQNPQTSIHNTFDNEIWIKNANGLENLPLHAGLLGTQSILNDGKTPNTLIIGLENIAIADPAKPNAEKIYYDTNTRLIISYKLEPNHTSPWVYPWALTTQGAFDSISSLPAIKLNRQPTSYWKAARSKDGTAWEIKAQSSQSFSPQDVLSIELSGIIAALPDGVSHIYVHYYHIKGYYDGFFSIPVTKSPLFEEDDKIGLGILPLQHQALQVNGGILARMGPPGNDDTGSNGYAFSENKNTGLFSVQPNQLSFYIDSVEQMRVDDSLYMHGNIVAQNALRSGRHIVVQELANVGVSVEAGTTITAGSSITAGAAIFAKGGKPGGYNANNAGFAFTGNDNGDEDSGLYSAANGEAIMYSNGNDRLVVNSDAVTIKKYAFAPDPSTVLFNIDNDGMITYAKPNSKSGTILGGTRAKPTMLTLPDGSGTTDDWSIVVSLAGFGHENDKNLNWMHVYATPVGKSWHIVGEVCRSDGETECNGNGTAVNVNYLIIRK